MEAAAPAASSRVIVELTDPSNLWDAFEPLLSRHLPLRNLHWKSTTRPLRSIETLHVSVTRAEDGVNHSKQGQRRHQIPGLKQTPYLKIYLLRCDDSEVYREICRKQIREWIKNNAQTTGKKSSNISHEKHDTFEWLIVHLVLPDTVAATQPKISKHAGLGTTESSDSVGSKSKWPGKSSSTLYEKLRADFSSSSKSALERVAQIRLAKEDVHGLSQPSVLPPGELEGQWDDLVEKLKACILSSFHIRVTQYEEDIRERDSQRHLPGWNFCTFFILKEGLAQGFENVGLLEDASSIYEELAVGLDVVMREQGVKGAAQDGSLLPFSRELKDKIRSALDDLQNGSNGVDSEKVPDDLADRFLEPDKDDLLLSTTYKNYREMILANDVSPLDFRIYVFTRQMELLHRRVEGASSLLKRSSVVATQNAALSTLAEICRRASTFINLSSRAMEHDLYNAWGGRTGIDEDDLQIQQMIINNIVCTWAWRTITQILSETASNALTLPEHMLEPSAAHRHTIQLRNDIGSKRELEVDVEQIQTPVVVYEDTTSKGSSQGQNREIYTGRSDATALQSSLRAAIHELAASRGELFLLARKTLETACPDSQVSDSEVPPHKPLVLNGSVHPRKPSLKSTDEGLEDHHQSHTGLSRIAGLQCAPLRSGAESRTAFNVMYERLTSLACRHFLAAEKNNSAEKAVIDFANWKYSCGEFATAAQYFEHVSLVNPNGSWTLLAESVLGTYSECLERLHRDEDLVSCFLDMLLLSSGSRSVQNVGQKEVPSVQRRVDDLASTSHKLNAKLRIPFHKFFELSSDETPACHVGERHGICVSLSLRLKVAAAIDPEKGTSLTLVAIDNTHPVRIRLDLEEFSAVDQTFSTLRFESPEMTLGWYRLELIELCWGNLIFTHNFSHGSELDSHHFQNQSEPSLSGKPILIFPPATAPILKARPSTKLDLSRPRQIRIDLISMGCKMKDIFMSFKPATAGLRLRLGEASLTDEVSNKDIHFSLGHPLKVDSLPSGSQIAFNVPYTMENMETTEVDIRAEISYTTKDGDFVYHTLRSVSTILHVSVNVHDIFKEGALFSHFTITPSTLVPLRLRSCRIEDVRYETAHGSTFAEPVDVFPKQPASWICKLTPKQQTGSSHDSKAPTLMIEFESVDEMVLSTIEAQFLQDIESSECWRLSALLRSHLLRTYRAKWTEQDLETACMLHEVEVWSFDDLDWWSILDGLEKNLRHIAAIWLHAWHDRRRAITLSVSVAPTRFIGIPIEIPSPRTVISVSLDLKPEAKLMPATSVGQVIAAEIVISCTDQWRPLSSPKQNEVLEATFEVSAPPEDWLLGGSRRGTIELDNGKASTQHFQVLLLPQHAGYLLLPSIEAKCFSISDSNGRIEVACETDYKSQAKSVLIIPDIRNTMAILREEGCSVASGD